jgi:hypothetical protein
MIFFGKESDLLLARLERFLSIPFPNGMGRALAGTGAIILIPGFVLWFATSDWLMLLGANMVYLGLVIAILGIEIKGISNRLALTPLAGFLGWFAIRRIMSMTLILKYRNTIENVWRQSDFDFIKCSAKAELIGAFGVFAFWFGWRLARRRREVYNSIELLKPPFDRSLWGAYAISLSIYGLHLIFPQAIARLGSFGGQLIGMSNGIAFATAIFWCDSLPLISVLSSIVLVLPFSTNVMSFGMKSAFINPFLPALHALMLRSLKWPLLISVALLPFFLLFVSPYIQAFREESWYNEREVKEGVLAQEVWQDVQKAGYWTATVNSWEKFQGRYSSIGVTGAIVGLVESEGHLGPLFLENLRYAFIPRLLWANKPVFEPASWLSDKLFGITSTATAFHLPMEWFWMFGWSGTFLGLSFLGFVYAWFHRYLLLNSLRGPVFLAGWFVMFLFICGIEESRSNTTFQQPLILFSVTWTMHWLSRIITLIIGNTQKKD